MQALATPNNRVIQRLLFVSGGMPILDIEGDLGQALYNNGNDLQLMKAPNDDPLACLKRLLEGASR